MDLGFFTMPVHPIGRPWAETLREDRDAFCLAEELGFTEAYVGEHVTDAVENITSSIVFLASLADRITRMRLGTGTVNLPNMHPAMVAAQIAMLDHLLGGRFNFGISPGGLLSDAELFGNLDADRNAMFVEAIDMILAIWAGEPPYDIKGRFWTTSVARTQLTEIGQGYIGKPMQKPYPPIVVTAVAPFSKGVTAAAARGWDPISANFLLPRWVATHRKSYEDGCRQGGRPADLANWRVAKSVFVADDPRIAEEYARGPDSPYVFYYRQLFTKLVKNGRANLFKEDQNAPDESVRFEDVLDKLIIHGTPDKVTDELLAFRDTVGHFGTLLYAAPDWVDKRLGIRSMELLSQKVLPAVNSAIARASTAA
jgi:alkanesulfonate monooxygenase SsuD/methylene tetrahydromethanopterin reductase-like flavin-dependent oxidoreductase (luciferase family)